LASLVVKRSIEAKMSATPTRAAGTALRCAILAFIKVYL
jgi:hypothetical protein